MLRAVGQEHSAVVLQLLALRATPHVLRNSLHDSRREHGNGAWQACGNKRERTPLPLLLLLLLLLALPLLPLLPLLLLLPLPPPLPLLPLLLLLPLPPQLPLLIPLPRLQAPCPC